MGASMRGGGGGVVREVGGRVLCFFPFVVKLTLGLYLLVVPLKARVNLYRPT